MKDEEKKKNNTYLYTPRLKKALDQNKGRVKLAIALNASHAQWKQRAEDNAQKQKQPVNGKTRNNLPKTRNNFPKKKITEEKSVDISEDQRKMIASFKYAVLGLIKDVLMYFLRFRQILEARKGSIKVANILHESTMMSQKYRK